MSKQKDRFKTIQALRKQGHTFQEIGDMLKLSRQRVHQIYKTGLNQK